MALSIIFVGSMIHSSNLKKMAAKKEIVELYELILESPGLGDHIKLDSRITCRTALMLVLGLEFAMTGDGTANPLNGIMTGEDVDVLAGWKEEVLQKAKLKGFYEKLKKLEK
jgi:hypothetical protein